MAKSKFYRADGSLTAYAFACGYVEVEKMGKHSRITLSYEHGVYHVKGFISGLYVGQTFNNLEPARTFFATLAAQVRQLPEELPHADHFVRKPADE